MNSYPNYKNADVRWLSKIPEHWQVKPLFAVLLENKLTNRGNQEDNVLSLSYGKIIRRDISQNFGLLPDSFETYQIVNPGNIVLRLTDLQNDKKSLRVGFVKEQGIITSAYTCLVSTPEVLPEYAYYLLHAYDLMKVFYNEGAGVRQSMNFRDLRRMPVLIPSLPEQKTIVVFLDLKTAQIDTLIAKIQRQIELLQEQRAAIIIQAVTKGLDPSYKMKDSGIDWIGNIPKHWETTQLKYSDFVIMGQSPKSEEYNQDGFGLPFLQGNADFDYLHPIPRIWCDSANKIALKGDLLLSVRAPIGAVNIADQDYGIGRGLCAIRAVSTSVDFLYLCLLSMKEEFNSRGTGSTFTAISSQDVRDALIPKPSIGEQLLISDYLQNQRALIQSSILSLRKQVDLLRDFRTSLISEAVTGKIDIRGEA